MPNRWNPGLAGSSRPSRLRVGSIIRRARVVFSGGRARDQSRKTFDVPSSRAEEKDRAELRVEAAADDQLIAVVPNHRLDDDPREAPGSAAPARSRTEVSIAAKGAADGFGVRQVEPDSADRGLGE